MFVRFGLAALSGAVIYLLNMSNKVDLDKLHKLDLKQSVILYDRDGNWMTHIGDLQLKTDFDEMPKRIINTLLATEDMYFWSHFGLNIPSMLMAVKENFSKTRIVRGGSTITQQLAKNLLLQSDPTLFRKKSERKVKEIALAIRIEQNLSKEQIVEHYLNRVYFGRGAYGIRAAAKVYFNKALEDLILEEVAFLIGLIKAPSLYSSNYKKSIERAAHVLGRLRKVGFIDKVYTEKDLESIIKPQPYGLQHQAGYFANWVVSTIPEYIAKTGEPVLLYTTLNMNLQAKAVQLIPKIRAKSRFNFSEISMVASDMDGAISAMIGGMKYVPHGFNRATQAQRQAGSTFKIYIYLAAFLQGMKYSDTVEDTPPTIGGWTPSNYMHNEVGFVTLERAFAESINGATVRVAMDCGLNNITNIARICGVTGPIPNDCSMILGSACVNPYQLLQTVLLIANKGQQKIPYGIREIRNHNDEVLWTKSDEVVQLITDQDAIENMLHVMQSVVQKGTGRYANNNKYPVGGKTGTSQDYRDIWFCATSPFMAVCAWCGNDDNTPMNKSKKVNLVNPSVAFCKEILDIEAQDYEPDSIEEEGSSSDVAGDVSTSIQNP